jgi:hypothetical protein
VARHSARRRASNERPRQFERASAPIMLQPVQTMRGPKAGREQRRVTRPLHISRDNLRFKVSKGWSPLYAPGDTPTAPRLTGPARAAMWGLVFAPVYRAATKPKPPWEGPGSAPRTDRCNWT